MPTVAYDLQRPLNRLRDQRALLDRVIELTGPEFDQSRLHDLSAR